MHPRSCLVALLLLATTSLPAQKHKKHNASPTETTSFDYSLLNRLIQNGLNKFRIDNNLDTLERDSLLLRASGFSSGSMADGEKVNVRLLPKTTSKNLKDAGGSGKGGEVIIVTPLGKGKSPAKPADVANTIVTKWISDKKSKDILLNPAYVFTGISCATNEDEKRVYVSAIMGGYNSFNEGAGHRKEMKVPFNTKSKKLKDPDVKKCRNCEKFKDYEALQKGLIVENGKIYLAYNNLKALKRLLKKSTDGIAVDIVQKEQYMSEDYTIVDNTLRNKGVMLKPLYKDKLLSKNQVKPDGKKKNQKVNKLKVELGKFPKNITGPYEMNLLVIQDKYVCKTVIRSYTEYVDKESGVSVEMLPMPESNAAKIPAFEPKSESALLNFKIPFEKNKSEFKKEDIKPFIDALQEPDFFIEALVIYAYASIEGDSVANAKLQRKRAESVVKVLQQMQQNKISPDIKTTDSWDMFRLETEDGKYDYLSKMKKQQAVAKINTTPGFTEELEPILSKERFAEIVMDVTYDISGSKEEKFSLIQFNRAVKTGNIKQAYKIMDYIAGRVREEKYSPNLLEKLEIPMDKKNIGILMNRIYYDYLLNNKTVSDDHLKDLAALQKIDGSNNIINYNMLFCRITLDSASNTDADQTDIQQKIDALYKTGLPKTTVDNLNVELQFRIMDGLDTLEGTETKRLACIDKIKSFYNFKEGGLQNTLKLAYAFARAKDYTFACTILEPFLKKPTQKLLFAYVSFASHVPEKFYSRKFSTALQEIRRRYRTKYCKLFGETCLSFQVLDNPDVKKAYLSARCTE